MEPTKNEIRREIEATRAAMAEKIQTLEARVSGAVQEAKRSVSPTYQTRRRPWVMMGVAVAFGYLLEGIVFGRAPAATKGRKFQHDPERRAYLEGQQKSSGLVRSMATAAGVALARGFATNLLSKGSMFGSRPASSPRSPGQWP